MATVRSRNALHRAFRLNTLLKRASHPLIITMSEQVTSSANRFLGKSDKPYHQINRILSPIGRSWLSSGPNCLYSTPPYEICRSFDYTVRCLLQ